MSPHQHSSRHRPKSPHTQQPSGGAIIDAQGREIPITEGMIRKACRLLDRTWVAAPHQTSPTPQRSRPDD